MDKASIFKISGLPDSFGVILLIFSFILLLSPYLSGSDFGIFKIPVFIPSAKRWLRIIGPIMFSICVLSFLPIIPAKNSTAATSNGEIKTTVTPSPELRPSPPVSGPTPNSNSAQSSGTGGVTTASYAPCVNQYFAGTPNNRMDVMEVGAVNNNLITNPKQSIGQPFVIQFTQNGNFIGAIKFVYYSEDINGMLFKVVELRGAQCQVINDYSNPDTGEVRSYVHAWGWIQMRLNDQDYYLRLGYTKNNEVDRIEAVFTDSRPH